MHNVGSKSCTKDITTKVCCYSSELAKSNYQQKQRDDNNKSKIIGYLPKCSATKSTSDLMSELVYCKICFFKFEIFQIIKRSLKNFVENSWSYFGH